MQYEKGLSILKKRIEDIQGDIFLLELRREYALATSFEEVATKMEQGIRGLYNSLEKNTTEYSILEQFIKSLPTISEPILDSGQVEPEVTEETSEQDMLKILYDGSLRPQKRVYKKKEKA